MAGEWRKLSLREAGVELIDCDHRTPPDAGTGYPYVAIPQMQGGHIRLSGVRKITLDNLREWTKKANPKANDVVLSRRCNPGETAHVSGEFEFALGQNLVILRSRGGEVHPTFLRWLVRGPEWWEQIGKFLNVGAVFDSLRCADVPKFELTIPPMNAQQDIAGILGALDDKIELNRKMNETLEAMARAFFKSWFVDFDPVRAKAEGRTTGLPAHIAALFPDSFDCSEQDDIPDGWGLMPLHEIAEFANGAAYRDMHFSQSNDGLPVIKIAELKSGVTGATRFTTTNLGEKYRIDSREILFSWSGNPDTSIDTFVWDGGPAWLNQHIFRVRAREDWSRVRIYCQLRLLRPVFAEIARNKQTTGLGHVTIADMKRLFVCRPPKAVAKAFDGYANPIFERMITNQSEIRTLAILRDVLLPKLISGELQIPQAERLVEVHI